MAKRVEGRPRGKVPCMEPSHVEHGSPEVTAELHGHAARLTVSGELTDAARRPLVREVTDLLLTQQVLHRIDLDLVPAPHGGTRLLARGVAPFEVRQAFAELRD